MYVNIAEPVCCPGRVAPDQIDPEHPLIRGQHLPSPCNNALLPLIPSHHSTLDRVWRFLGSGAYGHFDLAALIAGLLIPLGPDGDRNCRAADGTTGKAPYDAVLLVDGVFLLQAALRPYWDVGIYLHINEEEMLRRGVLRDRDRYGGEDAVHGLFATQFVPGWRTYQAEHDPAAVATIVIDHHDPAHPAIRPSRT